MELVGLEIVGTIDDMIGGLVVAIVGVGETMAPPSGVDVATEAEGGAADDSW